MVSCGITTAKSVTLSKRADVRGQKSDVVDVTTTEGNRREVRERHIFEASIDINEAGDYSLLLDVGQKMARRHNLCIDGKAVIEMQNTWLPPTASKIVRLEKGHHTLTAELTRGDKPVELTGECPQMPKWALGYIHCRERFHSSKEILETARRFKRERMPISMIVQDWQYWGKYGWN